MASYERFRLRSFMDLLVRENECRVISDPVDLLDVGGLLEGETKAVWFKAVGPEHMELVGNVAGSRRRLALAFGVEQADLPAHLRNASRSAIPPTEIPSAEAPVHQVVLIGEKASFLDLPVHLQHGLD